MDRVLDLSGQRFGRLLVLCRVLPAAMADPPATRSALWHCRCACGREVVVNAGNLRSGNTRSCGCARRAYNNQHARKHGMHGTSTWRSWQAMRARCRESDGPYIDPAWRDDFAAFYAYMGERPPGKTLDQIEPGGGYYPGNCRWATAEEQAENRSTTRTVEYRGRRMSLTKWAAFFGLSGSAFSGRVRRNGISATLKAFDTDPVWSYV